MASNSLIAPLAPRVRGAHRRTVRMIVAVAAALLLSPLITHASVTPAAAPAPAPASTSVSASTPAPASAPAMSPAQAAVSAPAADEAGSSAIGELMGIVLPLVLIIVVLLAVLYLVRRRFGLTGQDAPLSVLQILPLGPRERLVLVRSRSGRIFTVGVAAQSVTFVTHLDAADLIASDAPPTSPTGRTVTGRASVAPAAGETIVTHDTGSAA